MSLTLEGLRTVIYPAPDLQAAKQWWSQLLGTNPYFDQPFYVGFNVSGYELALMPDANPADGALVYWDAEIASINIGGNPWGIAVDPTTDRVYLANDTSPGTASMVDFKGYPIVGGTPPPTIPTTTTTTPASLDGTLCGILVKSGALKTLDVPKYVIDINHSAAVTTFGECDLVGIAPNNYTGPTGGAVFAVEQSLPISVTAGGAGKPVTGLGPGAVLYGDSEIPAVAWHHGKMWALLEFSWDEEVTMTKINAKLPALEAAARQVYAVYG
jgi:hypothetical protein